jgi:ABC-type phosphate transport system substrate-binding protein
MLTLNTLRAIFSMRKTHWADGSKISVYILSYDDNKTNLNIHTQFVTNILKLLPYQLKKAWDRNIFSGTGESPFIVINSQQMLNTIANTLGAIGYIPHSLATAIPQQVKIITVTRKQ